MLGLGDHLRRQVRRLIGIGISFATTVALAGAPADAARSPKTMDYGKTPDGTPVQLYVLQNGRTTVKISTYGGIITEIDVPDRAGKSADITLGFDGLEGYLGTHPYFGATVGRVANRVARAKFTLDGEDHALAANDGPHSLHGGLRGFDKVVWTAEPTSQSDGPAVRLAYRSRDGEEGYPGNLQVAVTFTVTDRDELRIEYAATTDKATPVNLSNHTYFNLAGRTSDTILGHELTLFASHYTPVDDNLIPTGLIAPVAGTPLDFTKPSRIGARIDQIKATPRGYDHNFVIDLGGKPLAAAARVYEPKSGRVLEMFTTEPGVQFYTGNFLDGTLKGKGGIAYRQHSGFCLEAQHFPDSVHQPNFPSVILRPGKFYIQTTVYRFTTK